jgi:hypothetical protein
MSTVQDAIAAIQDIALTLTGIRAAPDYAPDKLPPLPAVITYPAEGSFEGTGGSGASQDMHTIYCEVHVARKDLARDVALLVPFIDTFRNAIVAAPTLAGTVVTIKYPIRYVLLEREFGTGNKTLALRFVIVVKQINILT